MLNSLPITSFGSSTGAGGGGGGASVLGGGLGLPVQHSFPIIYFK